MPTVMSPSPLYPITTLPAHPCPICPFTLLHLRVKLRHFSCACLRIIYLHIFCIICKQGQVCTGLDDGPTAFALCTIGESLHHLVNDGQVVMSRRQSATRCARTRFSYDSLLVLMDLVYWSMPLRILRVLSLAVLKSLVGISMCGC